MENLELKMKLFGRKEKTITETPDVGKREEEILKEMLEEEVEKLQKDFRVKNSEIKETEEKLSSVKKEYQFTVSNLMELKKETNQKILELDVIKREYKEFQKKIEEITQKEQKNKIIINEIENNESNLKKVKKELEELTKKENEIIERISKEQIKLQEIKLQEGQNRNKSEGIIPEIDANHESRSSDNTFIFSDKEKKFIKDQIGPDQYTKGIIEAASVVTASLKSKLNVAQKELETLHKLLENERKDHMITKEMLEKLQNKESKNKL